MSFFSDIKNKIFGWLFPSKWIEALQGKKRILGALSLTLWAILFAIPQFCVAEGCIMLGEYTKQAHDILSAAGIELDDTLFNAGAGLTVIGLIDRILGYWVTDKTKAGLEKIEKVIKLE